MTFHPRHKWRGMRVNPTATFWPLVKLLTALCEKTQPRQNFTRLNMFSEHLLESIIIIIIWVSDWTGRIGQYTNLSSSNLTGWTEYEKNRNKKISKVRYIVEQYFGLSHFHDSAKRARFTDIAKNKFDVWYRQTAFNISRGLKILKLATV